MSGQNLGKRVPSEAGLLLRVTLLDDIAAPGGHGAEQQALAQALRVCGRQLGDVAHGLESPDLNTLTVALKLHVALRETDPVTPRCFSTSRIAAPVAEAKNIYAHTFI